MRVLFVCTHNASSESDGGGSIARNGRRAAFDVYSAGTEPGVVHPLAIAAMTESGIDISGQHAKSCRRIRGAAVRLCDHALRRCQRDLPILSECGHEDALELPRPLDRRRQPRRATRCLPAGARRHPRSHRGVRRGEPASGRLRVAPYGCTSRGGQAGANPDGSWAACCASRAFCLSRKALM